MAESKMAISAIANPSPEDFHTAAEWTERIAAFRRAVGDKVTDPSTGEDITDIVPQAETGTQIWARFNLKKALGIGREAKAEALP